MTATLHISGPMTGITEHNFPAFDAAAKSLGEAGFTVRNPAAAGGGGDGKSWAEYLRLDLRDVLDADGIAVLPNWSRSKGAQLEAHVARALGVPVRTVDDWLAGVEAQVPLPPTPVTTLEVFGWQARNFGVGAAPNYALVVAEEAGEVCRAVLKREQGIRGTREEWTAELRIEVADAATTLHALAGFEGFDLYEAMADRWADVSQRDFKKNPQGHGLPEREMS